MIKIGNNELKKLSPDGKSILVVKTMVSNHKSISIKNSSLDELLNYYFSNTPDFLEINYNPNKDKFVRRNENHFFLLKNSAQLLYFNSITKKSSLLCDINNAPKYSNDSTLNYIFYDNKTFFQENRLPIIKVGNLHVDKSGNTIYISCSIGSLQIDTTTTYNELGDTLKNVNINVIYKPILIQFCRKKMKISRILYFGLGPEFTIATPLSFHINHSESTLYARLFYQGDVNLIGRFEINQNNVLSLKTIYKAKVDHSKILSIMFLEKGDEVYCTFQSQSLVFLLGQSELIPEKLDHQMSPKKSYYIFGFLEDILSHPIYLQNGQIIVLSGKSKNRINIDNNTFPNVHSGSLDFISYTPSGIVIERNLL
ncbi:MAG: hypothetical protein KDC92_08060 [Bacteroidetes bacterium]|nr:hypothetical protein [Bacteroidota bacterium]